MTKTDDIVYFENSNGDKFSNDPRWIAEQTLKAYGMGLPSTQARVKAEDFDIPGLYDALSGPELKALTKERGISTKGFRKASQFRAVLETWDDENPSDDKSNGSEDPSDSGDDRE